LRLEKKQKLSYKNCSLIIHEDNIDSKI